MIVLDTNVVSEALRPLPAPQVGRWLSLQPTAQVFVTAVTAAELRRGVSVLPPGHRRANLFEAIEAILTQDFSGRVLPFDLKASEYSAQIVERRRSAGRPIDWADALIAAIARSKGSALATRNVRHFEGIEVDLIDPWAT